MRENRVKSENEIGIFASCHQKPEKKTNRQDRGDIVHFFRLFPQTFWDNFLAPAASPLPNNSTSVIFNLGKFLNINPRHKKSKRQKNKEKAEKAIRLNDRYVIASRSIMYDKRNKMENIYLMFSHVCQSAAGGVMAMEGYQGDVLFGRPRELENSYMRWSCDVSQ